MSGGRGAPRTITDAPVDHVVTPTLQTTPWVATHWNTRAMASRCGLSPSSSRPTWGQLLWVHLGGRARGPLLTSNRGTRLSVRRIQSIVRSAPRRAGVHKKMPPFSASRLGHGRPERGPAARYRSASARAQVPADDGTLQPARYGQGPREYDIAMQALNRAPERRPPAAATRSLEP
jgi:hypothetical protein